MDRDWNGLMFDDIGRKMKWLAKTVAWFNITISIIAGIVMFLVGVCLAEYLWYYMLLAPIVAAWGCFVAWISSLALYWQGELIEKTTENEKNTRKIVELLQQKKIATPEELDGAKPVEKPQPEKSVHKWRCVQCGNMRTQTPCEYCGHTD